MATDIAVTPQYQEVDGFKIASAFSVEAFNSALKYKPRDDDFFVVTYPKCGTTWAQYIIGSIFRNGNPWETAMEFLSQTPFLEMMGAEAAEKMERPGAIKFHLPFHMTPYNPKAKYVFVARNPKDCCVSFYYHTKNLPLYGFEDGTFDTYFELFINGQVDFGDYFDTLLSWYEHKDDPNVLFLTYEELKKDTKSTILKIAEFMDPKYKEAMLENPDFLASVIKYSSLNYMKEFLNNHFTELDSLPKELFLDNPDVPIGLKKLLSASENIYSKSGEKSQFVRKGIVGDWKNHFSKEQNDRLEAKFMERTKGTDIPKLWEDCMF